MSYVDNEFDKYNQYAYKAEHNEASHEKTHLALRQSGWQLNCHFFGVNLHIFYTYFRGAWAISTETNPWSYILARQHMLFWYYRVVEQYTKYECKIK